MALFVLAIVPFMVSAKVDNDFLASYGLVSNLTNQDLPLSRLKALESLLAYFGKDKYIIVRPAALSFTDVRPNTKAYGTLQRGCSFGVVDCSQTTFGPFDSISQKDFLDWFFGFKYSNAPNTLEVRYPNTKNDFTRNLMEARRLNLLTGDSFTYNTMQEFLYRNAVSEANMGIPYREVLVLDKKDITPSNYHNLKEIENIQVELASILTDFEAPRELDSQEKKFVEKIRDELAAFGRLRISLLEDPYILTERPDLNSQVTQLVKHFGLQEVLNSYTYDYSKNAAYRKYNLVTGIEKIQNKLLMPGEILDYWIMVSDKNLSDFKYGWVIANGVEAWQFGGGLCGSATMVFIPMWKAGLEVVERKSHSLFYSNLYPKENIGLDATVYRPKPNLRIRNSFESPVVFNVINDTEKELITVEVIGNKDFKSIQVEGPIYTGKRAVKWIRQFEGFDGTIATDTLESRYNAIY